MNQQHRKRAAVAVIPSEPLSLRQVRIAELDREFKRQARELRQLTQRIARKIEKL